MNFGFELKELRAERGGTLYSYIKESEDEHEHKKFISRHQRHTHLPKLIRKLNRLVKYYGFDADNEDDFKWAGLSDSDAPIYRISHIKKLRLFCLVWSRCLLIADNGGIKKRGPIKAYPDLYSKTLDLEHVYSRLQERISESGIKIVEEQRGPIRVVVFDGVLKFEREQDD